MPTEKMLEKKGRIIAEQSKAINSYEQALKIKRLTLRIARLEKKLNLKTPTYFDNLNDQVYGSD